MLLCYFPFFRIILEMYRFVPDPTGCMLFQIWWVIFQAPSTPRRQTIKTRASSLIGSPCFFGTMTMETDAR
jgi:hypothetical protein